MWRSTLHYCALHRPIMRVRVGSRAVAPVEVVFIELGRAGAQVLQRQLDHEGLTRGIEPECVPPHGIMVVAGEHPAGFYHGIRDSSAHLVQHQSLDRPEFCAVTPIDVRALDAITGHQGMRHGVLPVFPCSPGIIAQASPACAGVRSPRCTDACRTGGAKRYPSYARLPPQPRPERPRPVADLAPPGPL